MNEREFFDYLRKKTEEIFKTTSIYKTHPDKNWNYAICDTTIKKGKPIIFGLNWGGNDIDAQSEYPKDDKSRNWNFISHSNNFFQEYLKISDISEVNYSNLCFFRSPKVHLMKDGKDWELAIDLFNEYVHYIKPSLTVMLGKTGIPKLNSNKSLTDLNRIEEKDKRKRVFGYKGKLFGKYSFACVPHPQVRISTETRENIWRKVFGN